MTGLYIPPGLFAEAAPPTPDVGSRRRQPSYDILKRLPGSLEWAFECIADGNALVVGAPITAQPASGGVGSFLIRDGFEGMVDWVAIMNNPLGGGGNQHQWNAAITLNAIPAPGWEFIGQLKASDSNFNYWSECEIFVPENSLVELRMVNFAAGGAWVVGGRLHGWYWPIRSRLDWESMHPERT